MIKAKGRSRLWPKIQRLHLCLISPRNLRCCRKARVNPRNKTNLFQVDFFPFPLGIHLTGVPPSEYSDCSMASPYPLCGICFEPFQLTHSPISASLAANSSAKLPFGLRLPCPGQHPYCISCLVEYIKGKLDPNGTGDMSTQILVFPILCPECPITHWEAGIQDEVAEKVLDRESMSVWVCPASKESYGPAH